MLRGAAGNEQSRARRGFVQVYMQECTDGSRILHTLLVKYFNTLLDRLSSERGKDEVKYLYVGVVFCIHLGTKYADFQEKIFAEISGNIQSVELFPRNLQEFFFVENRHTKNDPNIEVCNFILAPLRTLPIKQVIVVLY